MTMATVPGFGTAARLARGAAVLGFALAIIALLLLAAGPIGWRAGWWHFRVGLLTLLPDAGYAGAAAAVISVLALIIGARTIARGGIVLAVLGLLIGGAAAYFPLHWNSERGVYPRLNDVTTDADNPPSLAFAEAMRQGEHGHPVAYGGAKVAEVQHKSYPDIKPAILDLPPAAAFKRALAAATAKGWTIVKADPATGSIDADDRSRWFGFTDDIAIRVSQAGEGSRVDIRSASRQGRSDFGVNAARVRGYLAALGASTGN
jgi:uncharacterized protein (DUF1499 family)